MKKYFPVLLLVLSVSSPLYAKSISEIDGNEWNSWDKSSKGNFIIGYISGSCFTADNNNDDVSLAWRDPENPTGAVIGTIIGIRKMTEEEFKLAKKKNELLKRYCITGISVSQLVDGLDTFYRDFKNRSIRVNISIYVVRKQIQGASDEELGTVINFLRRMSNETVYGGVPGLKYKNSSGEELEVSFP